MYKTIHLDLPEIRVVSLDAVIQDRHDDTFASESACPGGLDVHVEAATSSTVEMPLLVEHWIFWKTVLPLRDGVDR